MIYATQEKIANLIIIFLLHNHLTVILSYVLRKLCIHVNSEETR